MPSLLAGFHGLADTLGGAAVQLAWKDSADRGWLYMEPHVDAIGAPEHTRYYLETNRAVGWYLDYTGHGGSNNPGGPVLASAYVFRAGQNPTLPGGYVRLGTRGFPTVAAAKAWVKRTVRRYLNGIK